VLPEYQAEISAGQDSWIKELTAENSLNQEYLAAINADYG